jgi:hypothetical protein
MLFLMPILVQTNLSNGTKRNEKILRSVAEHQGG